MVDKIKEEVTTTELQRLEDEMQAKREEYDRARKAYLKAYDKSKNVDFKGKFLQIGEVNGDQEFLYVEEQFKTQDEWTGDFREYWVLRGFGFTSCITPYQDASYFTWDWWYEVKLFNDQRLNDALGRIKVITKEEFRSEFESRMAEFKTHADSIFDKTNYFDKAK